MSSKDKLHLPPLPSDSLVIRNSKASLKKNIILMLQTRQLGRNHWSVSSDGESFVNIVMFARVRLARRSSDS